MNLHTHFGAVNAKTASEGRERMAARRRVLCDLGLGDLVRIDPVDLSAAHLAHAKSLAVPGRFDIAGMTIDAPAGVYHPCPNSTSTTMIRGITALNPRPLGRVLEIGCGSGAVALFVAKEFGADILATDIDALALEATRANAKLNNLPIRVQQSDLFDNVSERGFDLVIFNIPLVDHAPLTEWDGLSLCDPGGDLIFRFASRVSRFLSPTGFAIFPVCSNSAYERLDCLPIPMRAIALDTAKDGYWMALIEAQAPGT